MPISTLPNNRWIRLGLAALLGLLLLLAALAYLLVDSRKVAAIAVTAVEKTTGRSLQLNGPVSLTLLPRLSVVARDVVLGNASWAADPVMAQADQVAFALDWLPLLRRQISINEVQLEGVVLNLQAAPAGQKRSGNWDLASNDAGAASETKNDEFHLQSLQLSDVAIHLRDAAGALTESFKVDQLTGRIASTQVDFNGVVRWQEQPIDLKGQLAIATNAPSNLSLAIQADRLALRRTDAAKETSPAKGDGTNARWIFDSQPLGLHLLPQINGTIDVALKTLVLPSGVVLPDFKTRILFDAASGGVLTLVRLQAGLGQGVIRMDGRIKGYKTMRPTVALRGHAEGFTLDQLMAQANPDLKSSQIQGGPGEFAFQMSASGATMRDWVSTMNGQFQASIGSAKFNSQLLNAGGDFVMSVLDAVNPFRKSSETTQLECAVAYLPIRNGLVSIAQSVGIETDRLNVVLDGQVNLKNEQLNIRIYPSEKSGLTTGVNAAGLVQINGTLRNPRLGLNRTGVVKQATSVGLAVFTGGLSLAAQNVAAIATRRSPCQNVLRPWSAIDGGLSAR